MQQGKAFEYSRTDFQSLRTTNGHDNTRDIVVPLIVAQSLFPHQSPIQQSPEAFLLATQQFGNLLVPLVFHLQANVALIAREQMPGTASDVEVNLRRVEGLWRFGGSRAGEGVGAGEGSLVVDVNLCGSSSGVFGYYSSGRRVAAAVGLGRRLGNAHEQWPGSLTKSICSIYV